MRAGELCIRDVVTAFAHESVAEAARRMADYHVGDLIVVDDTKTGLPEPRGIVTDRDLVVRVLARPDRSPSTTRIGDVMRHVLVVAREDDDVETVLALMRAHAIRRIPIIDRRGGLQGILSVDDVVGWFSDQLQGVTKLLDRQGQGPQLRLAPRFG